MCTIVRENNLCKNEVTSSIIMAVLLTNMIHSYIAELRSYLRLLLKGKTVPLHAMEALGGRGDIAPTHSQPRH
jgi:hypothetical protein